MVKLQLGVGNTAGHVDLVMVREPDVGYMTSNTLKVRYTDPCNVLVHHHLDPGEVPVEPSGDRNDGLHLAFLGDCPRGVEEPLTES